MEEYRRDISFCVLNENTDIFAIGKNSHAQHLSIKFQD
jgi:hypothetical protein